MSETMWKVLDTLRRFYLDPDLPVHLAVWHLEEEVGVKLAGCGVEGDPAVEKLVQLGLIEELIDLGCRFRIVVKDGE